MSFYSPGVKVRYYHEIRAVAISDGAEDSVSPVVLANTLSEYAVEYFYKQIQAMKQQV
jgi:hypothetical protein